MKTNETKFTPGPWNLTAPVPGDKEIFIEQHGDGWARLSCAVTRDDCDTDTALANARLVAAAPDLHAALAACVATMETALGYGDFNRGKGEFSKIAERDLKAGIAALQKATAAVEHRQ